MIARRAPLRQLHGWGRAVLDFLYPPLCPLCFDSLTREEQTLCVPCLAALRPDPDWHCPRCGGAGYGAAPERGGPCRLCPPAGAAYQGVFSVGGYSERAAQCVFLFKYQRRIELGRVMARLMIERLSEPLADLHGRLDRVAPVPLHWTRRLGRGFNQSDLLARALAAGLDLAYEPHLLRRVRRTRRQAMVPREERADNVRDAFRLNDQMDVDGQGILIIDDVVTTGYTINECARVLKEAGAREVWVACFARAGMGSSTVEDQFQV